MIERLQVRGYKSLVDVDVQLGPLTVFVGANGSGKTSVLEAIEWLQDAVLWLPPRDEKLASDEPYGLEFARVVSRQQDEQALHITADIEMSGQRKRLAGTFRERAFELDLDGTMSKLLELDESGSFEHPKAYSDQLPHGFVETLASVRMFRLDAVAMAEPSYSDETEPSLEINGENLGAVLDALQGEARERFDEIERRLKEFVPSLVRLRVKRARTRIKIKVADGDSSAFPQRNRRRALNVVGHQVSFDFEHATNIRADDASEGTMLLLGLLTVIESNPTDQPLTIMLDDLDRALHPKAQRELVGYLHGLIRSRPNLQIIATTHSPYLVEHLEFEEVRAITQAPDGSSVVGSLTDHPEAERWREEMSAGEFWSTVGESWVMDQRPGT